eukprot:g65474.t1
MVQARANGVAKVLVHANAGAEAVHANACAEAVHANAGAEVPVHAKWCRKYQQLPTFRANAGAEYELILVPDAHQAKRCKGGPRKLA